MSKLDQVHKALQKKANRELSEQFVKEVEDRVRAEIWEESKREAVAYWVNEIKKGLSKQMEYVMLLVLRDKEGYGHDRALDRLTAFEVMWGDVFDGRISGEDIENTVKEELRISIEADGIYTLMKNGERKKEVNFEFK